MSRERYINVIFWYIHQVSSSNKFILTSYVYYSYEHMDFVGLQEEFIRIVTLMLGQEMKPWQLKLTKYPYRY